MFRLGRELYHSIENFFFNFQALYQLGLMRFILSLSLFCLYAWRQLEVNYFYTNESGIILKNQALGLLPEMYRTPFPFFIWPDSWAVAVHALLLFLLLGLVLGVGGRLWTLITWFISVGFLQRNLFISYGGDMIGCIWLFYLFWTRHNTYFSVLNLFNKKRILNVREDIWSSAGARMIQIHLCILYAYTGLQKLKGASWWDGSALWLVFGNPQYTVIDMSWTAHWPKAVALLTFTTLIFEIYFSALIWNRKSRLWVQVYGFLLHFGIAVTMGIWAFAAIMISAYVLFINQPVVLRRFSDQLSARLGSFKSNNRV